MSTGLYTHRTRNAGEIVTDVLYNTAHQNQLQNDIPNQAGALSDTLSDYQATQDPAPGGVVNLVASILEEFQQLRFALEDIKTQLNGGTPLGQWYIPVDVDPTVQLGKGARVQRSTLQSIAFKTITPIVFDTVEYDTGVTDPAVDPFWSVSNPTRLTAKVDGLYQFNGFILMTSGGNGAVALFIRDNTGKLLAASEWVSDGSQTPQLAVSTQFLMSANQYVELVIFQTVASPKSVLTMEFGLELLNPTAVIPPPTMWTLTVAETGTGNGTITSSPGSINCPGVCSGSFTDGTMVTLTATPTVGGFVQWTGDVPVPDQFNNPLTVTMDQARTINALFTAYTLTISEAGNGSGTVTSDIGGINCPGTCSAQYAPGDIVQLTATATAGQFTEWTGDLVSTTNPDSITMDADKNVTATFELVGMLASFAPGGSTNLLGTGYLAPCSNTVGSASLGAVQFKLSIDIEIISISVTMAAALAGGHTIDFRFNVGGADDNSLVASLIAADIDKQANGSISVIADTLIAIKFNQSGGGGDNIQSLTVVYKPV